MDYRVKLNQKGYLCRFTNRTKKKKEKESRDWWLGKKSLNVTIKTLPERYWGKHIRIKVEVIDEDEVIEQEIVGGK